MLQASISPHISHCLNAGIMLTYSHVKILTYISPIIGRQGRHYGISREAAMKDYRFIFVFLLLIALFVAPVRDISLAQEDGDDITIGTYRTIYSNVLDEDRLLYVHLPRDYEDTKLSYPVLYLLYVDIYNYFADAVMITEKLGGTGEMPPVIIIGVANTNRYRDLLPAKLSYRDEGGGADDFLKFIEEELIPHIDGTYRTKDFRILAGPQAAAVFSLYALITRPGLFNAVISENPFMNPDNTEFLYPRAEQFFKNTESLANFLYIRCEKNERPKDLEYAERLDKLLAAEKPDGFRFEVEFREPSGYFIPPLPFRESLRMLFAGHKLPDDFQTNSVDDIIAYYKEMSDQYGFDVDPPAHMLTYEGAKLSRQGKSNEATALFEYQLGLYPKSLNALFQLGEIHLRTGRLEKAREYYNAFLEIRDVDVAMIHSRLAMVEKVIRGSAAYRIEQEINANGIEAGLKKYREIQNDPDNELYFDEGELNALGYRLMGNGNISDAIEIFRINVELHPESANVYDSLAEAYMNGGNTAKAIENYRRSLELNPDNTNAAEMLQHLEKK
jgi:predicted alpha/beta superfamily hydrolase/thioredoxin-like negative regulator of GroEL